VDSDNQVALKLINKLVAFAHKLKDLSVSHTGVNHDLLANVFIVDCLSIPANAFSKEENHFSGTVEKLLKRALA